MHQGANERRVMSTVHTALYGTKPVRPNSGTTLECDHLTANWNMVSRAKRRSESHLDLNAIKTRAYQRTKTLTAIVTFCFLLKPSQSKIARKQQQPPAPAPVPAPAPAPAPDTVPAQPTQLQQRLLPRPLPHPLHRQPLPAHQHLRLHRHQLPQLAKMDLDVCG